VFADIPLHNLWIFPGDEPGDLAKDQADAGVAWGASEPIIFRLSRSQPLHKNSGGSIQIADSTNFVQSPYGTTSRCVFGECRRSPRPRRPVDSSARSLLRRRFEGADDRRRRGWRLSRGHR
jgi:hypothetical protein